MESNRPARRVRGSDRASRARHRRTRSAPTSGTLSPSLWPHDLISITPGITEHRALAAQEKALAGKKKDAGCESIPQQINTKQVLRNTFPRSHHVRHILMDSPQLREFMSDFRSSTAKHSDVTGGCGFFPVVISDVCDSSDLVRFCPGELTFL